MNQIFSCSVNVFSTYVEVIPVYTGSGSGENSFLHVCGGDPEYIKLGKKMCMFSPRMWR